MILIPPASAWKLTCLITCVVICLPGVSSRIKTTSMSSKLSDCYRRFANVTLDRVVGKFLSWHCEAPLYLESRRPRLNNAQRIYIRRLAERIDGLGPRRGKRQARRCVRKEYRTLTTKERNDFHRAINGLKQNTIVRPNVYDALAMLHTEMQLLRAHGGPCFLGWHRVYLLMFEMALGDEVPGVCLPYWDSSLDSELDDPSQSYLFSPEFLGNGEGPIRTGPFAGWRRPQDVSRPNSPQSPVIRNVGSDGQLFSRESIEMILSRNDHSEIIAPNADPDYDIEVQHGGIHMFIGGDMEALETSPFDPIFYMHHAFVDYIWELFRAKMRNQLNMDPSRNYPVNHNIQFHGRDDSMELAANMTCGEGYSDQLMETVVYEASPSCTRRRPSCDSPYLRCQLDTGRCVPLTLQESPVPVNPNPGPGTLPPVDKCAHVERERHKVKPCQNTYCLNGICDINQWVYVPVKVVTLRSPGYKNYQSFPVVNGDLSTANDIYSPRGYSRTRQLIDRRQGKTPRGYSKCQEDGIGQIFFQSRGLNYDGVYKESALIDQRLATTMAIAYIAVKDPGRNGVTRALFRASDSCGRVCHTSCRNPRTGRFEPCSGIIELDSMYPLMYSKNYGDATLGVWNYGNGNRCPMFNRDQFFMTFYCDYQDHLPWVEKMTAPSMVPVVRPVPRPVVVNRQECRVSRTCVIDVPCYSRRLHCRIFGETHQCRGSCGKYAVCHYGHYSERRCPGGMMFSETMHRCTSSPCRAAVGPVPVFQTRWSFGQKPVNYVRSLGNRMTGIIGRFTGK